MESPDRSRGSSLILKRAALSRPDGEWKDDDYDVLAGGVVVGRIFNAAASPVGSPWMWTLIFGANSPAVHDGAMVARCAIATVRGRCQ